MIKPGSEGPKPKFQSQSTIFEHGNDMISFGLQNHPKAVARRLREQSLATAGKEEGDWCRVNLFLTLTTSESGAIKCFYFGGHDEANCVQDLEVGPIGSHS